MSGVPPRGVATTTQVLEHMQPMPSHVVLAIATAGVDARALAQQELRNRGVGVDGKWATFDHVAMQWDKYAQDNRETQRALVDVLKGIRARIPIGRGLSSAEAQQIDDVIAKAETRR